MKSAPAIALKRRQEAFAKFSCKLTTLERLLTDGSTDRFPKRVSASSFATWKDPELGVFPISRSIIYDKASEYLALRQRMEHLLNRVSSIRSKKGKKARFESDLRKKLEVEEERAQNYVNQFSAVSAELAEARKEIERLNITIRRLVANAAKTSPLRVIHSGSNEPASRSTSKDK